MNSICELISVDHKESILSTAKPIYNSPWQPLIDELENDTRVKAIDHELESAKNNLFLM